MIRQIQTATFGVPEYEPQREGIYRPRISARHLRRLWLEKQHTRQPITRIISSALDEYFKKQAK